MVLVLKNQDQDFEPQDQDQDQDFEPQDQDQDQDFYSQDQDQDQDFWSQDQDKTKTFGLKTKTRPCENASSAILMKTYFIQTKQLYNQTAENSEFSSCLQNSLMWLCAMLLQMAVAF